MSLEGLQLGQYSLQRLLGSGGMGEVYLAEDARIHQQVALKVSKAEASVYSHSDGTKDAIRLFQREAKAIARLDHPHILPLFSYGEETVNGILLTYLVMPYRREGTFASFGFFYLQGNNRTTQAPTSTNIIATTQANDATAFAATAAAHTNTFPPPGANLVLNDPLSNNDHGYNWETKPDAGGVCQFAAGAYQVDERQRVTEYCPAHSTSFGSPFAYEVQMAITQGDLGGLIVRDDTHSMSYYFRFRQNGDYDVVYYDNHSSQAHGPLVASNASIFSPGYNQSNLIAVVVRGNRIGLYVNNQYINSVSIGVYGSGYIGVFVTDKGNPTEAIFSNAKVWTL